MANDKMLLAALGRPFTLGMLYDARNEQIIPGATLWDEADLQKMTDQRDQHSSNSQITTFDSLEEKSSLLDVNASLKASFLGGLIEVEGSAKYLNDRKQSSKQSRATFQYNATTIFKQLMFTAEDLKKALQLSDVIKSSATHIVTGVLFGASAVFVFDSQASDASSVQEVEGSMKAVIKKIPTFNVEGNVDIKLTESEQALCDNMSCKFYGDFLLESNPATFDDAVKTYSHLPKLLKDKQEAGVAVKVWLVPLKGLIPSADELVAEVSPESVSKIQKALEDLYELKMRCNKCLEDQYNFPSIHEKLNNFKRCCDEKKAKLQDLLADNIPSIRAGEKKEDELLKFLDAKEESPYNTEELKKWMKNLEREVAVIRSLEEMMKPAKIIPSSAEMDAEIFNLEVEEALCFVFTSLESKENESNAWYLSDGLIEKAREKARMLGDLARALKNVSRYRCLVTAIDDPDHEGATIYHYRQAKLLTKDFSKPAIDDVKKITDRRDLIWYATKLTLDPDTAHPNIELSEDGKATHVEEPKPYPDLPQRFNNQPNVLCREKLAGRHYWEVEWSLDQKAHVSAAVCYGSMERKNDIGLGINGKSWVFSYVWSKGAKFLEAHGPKFTYIPVPNTGCPRVGMFLDFGKGTWSCYIVSGDQLSHVHTFSDEFSEPVYPALSPLNPNNFVRLCF